MKAGDQGCTSVSARATKGVYMVAKDSPWGRWVCVHDRFEGYEGRPSRVERVEILWVKTLTRPQSHILDSNSTAHVHLDLENRSQICKHLPTKGVHVLSRPSPDSLPTV